MDHVQIVSSKNCLQLRERKKCTVDTRYFELSGKTKVRDSRRVTYCRVYRRENDSNPRKLCVRDIENGLKIIVHFSNQVSVTRLRHQRLPRYYFNYCSCLTRTLY